MARLTFSQQVMQQMMMPIVFMALVIALYPRAAKRVLVAQSNSHVNVV